MKLKRLAGLLLFTPLLFLSACASTSGLTLTANWYASTTNYGGLTGTHEELTYAVAFEGNNSSSKLRLQYDNGRYTTLLESALIAESGNRLGYHYHTELEITGRYFYKGQQGADFTDTVVSDVWFLDVSEGLRPVRSEKTVKSTVPNTLADSVANVATEYNYRYVAEYNEALTRTTITYTDLKTPNAEPEVTELKLSGKGTFFDNEQVLFALRGVDMTSSLRFKTVNPATRETAKLASSDTPVSRQYNAEFSMKVGGGEPVTEARTLNTYSLSLGYSGNNPGRTQSYVYAQCTSPDANTYRNVLLHMETHALYDLGTFKYDLTAAVFAEK